MAIIDKKFIHFKNYDDFISQAGVGSVANITTPTSGSEDARNAVYGQIKGSSIVFIKDTKQIWTHGQLYSCNVDASHALWADENNVVNRENLLINGTRAHTTYSYGNSEDGLMFVDTYTFEGDTMLNSISLNGANGINLQSLAVNTPNLEEVTSGKMSRLSISDGKVAYEGIHMNYREEINPASMFALEPGFFTYQIYHINNTTGNTDPVSGLVIKESDVQLCHKSVETTHILVINDDGVFVDDKKVGFEMLSVTYSELKNLRDSAQLIPGAMYRITDYECTTIQSNSRSANHPFDIIVQALDESTLSENAQAIQHEGDEYFANAKLEAWQLKYSLDADAKRFAWGANAAREQLWSCAWGVLESKPNSDASSSYEKVDELDGKTKYLYRPIEPTSHLQGKQFYRDIVISSIESPDGFIYEADSAPSYSYDEEMGEEYYDYPSEIRVKTADGKQVALLALEFDDYYYDENNPEWYITFGSSYEEVDGVYYLTPESGIKDWWEYVVGGSISETEREYYNGAVDSLYYAFDTILPKSSKTVTEVTDKVHIYKTGGTIDTITYQSYISEEDGGKGVIYQLIDEFGNDCSYDFKNIQFMDNNVYYYTFSSSGNDASLNGTVRDNILMPYSDQLLITIFKGQAIGNKIQRVAETGPFIFEKSATNNSIRATTVTAKISAKGNFDSNVLLIRDELTTNGAFSNNHVQYLSSVTTINGDFYANQLDTMNRNDATLTINCGRIQQCTIYGCGTLSIANTNGARTGTMGYSTINLGMNGSNVKLLYNTTTSLNNRIEGLNIKASNWGTSEVAVDITSHPVNATYPLTIAKDTLGNVKMWCEADLIK